MMKKAAILVLSCLLTLSSVVLASAETAVPEETETEESIPSIMGGWTITEDGTVTEEMREIFDRAVAAVDDVYFQPEVLLATQLVAGTNYCFLAREFSYEDEGDPGYVFVYIYVDLEGNEQVLDIQDIKFGY